MGSPPPRVIGHASLCASSARPSSFPDAGVQPSRSSTCYHGSTVLHGRITGRPWRLVVLLFKTYLSTCLLLTESVCFLSSPITRARPFTPIGNMLSVIQSHARGRILDLLASRPWSRAMVQTREVRCAFWPLLLRAAYGVQCHKQF